jgi:hypothetical protein
MSISFRYGTISSTLSITQENPVNNMLFLVSQRVRRLSLLFRYMGFMGLNFKKYKRYSDLNNRNSHNGALCGFRAYNWL